MTTKVLKRTSGVTLMEVTLAVAIFAVAIAMSAQALISFYAAIDVQKQRVEAVQSARSILATVRQKRQDFQLDNDVYNWNGFLNWFSTKEQEGWLEYLRNDPGNNYLPNHEITVTVLNTDGEAAEAGDDPIEVHVRSEWTDLRGRTASAEIVGMFSER